MTKFLRDIAEALQQVDVGSGKTPKIKVGNGDKVVGTMSEELKKLYVLRAESKKKVENLLNRGKLLALSANGNDPAIESMMDEITIAASWHEAIEAVFWTSLRTEFPQIAAKPSIGIREGWQVVWNQAISGHEERRIVIEAIQIPTELLKTTH